MDYLNRMNDALEYIEKNLGIIDLHNWLSVKRLRVVLKKGMKQ